ncbi:DNA-binding transcriptional LysR family regulator [Stackebrandtia albiflava]|uniref:DNA-binding transcriptional LysR family regulator n=1 Tax=Stackebrandtia albiflava TaxID=406432 RepID=A0A562VD42_9ACTN|nr:LysR family transcriptional regulator [Stackebrandtia albiflava]TWJ15731.1 DNA-binding transcriptional LysR family regulator [Stackebrandtia albiflava]
MTGLQLLHQLRMRGTLTAAAEALRMSRSAASHRLASLERRTGVPLTERVGRGIRLTEAGVALADHAARVLTELERGEGVLERWRGELTGTLTVTAVQTIAINVMPGVLTVLRERHPGLRVECHTRDTEAAVRAVSAGDADVAVVPSYRATPLRIPPGVRSRRLGHDPLRVVLPKGHRLAEVAAVRLADLAAEPWITGEPDGQFGRLVPSLCRRHGFTPDVRHRSSDHLVIGALVSAGQGVALIPASARSADWHPVVVRPIAGERTGRDVLALTRDGSRGRPTVDAVLGALEEAGLPAPESTEETTVARLRPRTFHRGTGRVRRLHRVLRGPARPSASPIRRPLHRHRKPRLHVLGLRQPRRDARAHHRAGPARRAPARLPARPRHPHREPAALTGSARRGDTAMPGRW